MGRLDDKVAVITGGGKGIGKSCVEKFVREGAKVAILDWDQELAEKTAREVDPSGEKVIGLRCNVAERQEVNAAVVAALAKFGTIDILVNNAGITRDAIFHKMTEEQWDQVMAVNGKGLFNCTQECYKIMKEKKYGKIVNISSTSSSGNTGQANYAFSKAGIEGFTKTLAREAGRSNINVNAVRPGVIDTDMMNAVPDNILENFRKSTVFGRLGQPEEVADLVCYLSSDEASWITGEEILVAGGFIFS